MLETFRRMVNHCVGIGLARNVSSLKKLCAYSYQELKKYDCLSYYKLCAISRAAGILAARKKSLRRGFVQKSPYALKPILASCYGFKIERDQLRVALPNRKHHDIQLYKHTLSVLSEPATGVRSFTLTAKKVSLCISKEVAEVNCVKTAGVDMNLRNLTYGNDERVRRYDLSPAVTIVETTRSILSSFKRNDVRTRRKIASKYGKRR